MTTSSLLKERIDLFKKVLEEIPSLRYAGDPVLRQKTQEATLEEALQIAEKMKPVLLKYRELTSWGRGLAAPQIGESKAVFLTYVGDEFEVFINPKILNSSSESNSYKELCMSAGIVAADVERPEWIELQWTNAAGELKSQRFDGFLARLYQHEYAHLVGKFCLDEAKPGGIEFACFDPLKESLR